MLKAVKIKSELMKDIEGYVETREDFESRSDFVNKAIEEKLEKLHDEETASVFASIHSSYDQRQSIHREHGITSFAEYLDKVMKGSGQAKEITEIRKEMDRIGKEASRVLKVGKMLQSKFEDALNEKKS